MKKLTLRSLFAVMVCALTALIYLAPQANAGKLWIRCDNAPNVYLTDSSFGTWPGTTLSDSETSGGKTWWYYDFGNTTISINMVINSGSGQTRDLSLYVPADGDTYFYYNGEELGFCLDRVLNSYAKSYFFFQPNGNVDWTTSNALIRFDEGNFSSEFIGGYRYGTDVYFCYSGNAKTGNIKFERMNSDGTTTWNSFEAEYVKGGFYQPTDWNAGGVVDNQFESLVFPGRVPINETNFPDQKFREYVLENCNLGGTVDQSVTHLYLDDKGITDLTGIELFPNLTYLAARRNSIPSVDLSANTELTVLYLARNQIDTIDLSHNTNLEYLDLSYNQLSDIDISDLTALTDLELSGNVLTNKVLDFEDMPNIRYIYVRDCHLASLNNLKDKTNLYYVYALDNYFTVIDVSGCTSLYYLNLDCDNTFDHDGDYEPSQGEYQGLQSLNVTGCVNLERLNASHGKLTEIPGFTDCTKLLYIDIDHNQLTNTTISVTGMTDLETFEIDDNKLTSIDVTNNLKLTYLDVGENDLGSLDVTKNTELLYLGADQCGLENGIDLSNNTKLAWFSAALNGMPSLDVSNNPALEFLFIPINFVKHLDLSNNPELRLIAPALNPIVSLDLSNNSKIGSSEGATMKAFLDVYIGGGYSYLMDTESMKNSPLFGPIYQLLLAQMPEIIAACTPQMPVNDALIQDNPNDAGRHCYYLRLDNSFGEQANVENIFRSLEGYETEEEAEEKGFDINRVTAWTDAEEFHGTRPATAPRRTMAEDLGLVEDRVVGDILLIDPETTTYTYDTNCPNSDYQSITFAPAWNPQTPTAIKTVNTIKKVESVRYINVAGDESAEPWQGANIIVTRYNDGTSSVAKRIMK
ncbi:MAG: leucine-rich repeat domain-containing protein [Muribaculaceae bacterium]|nr:leucine-rich repeat domain-containing protein [Muribaculaceae bacterium]